jgi:hypothetical protein
MLREAWFRTQIAAASLHKSGYPRHIPGGSTHSDAEKSSCGSACGAQRIRSAAFPELAHMLGAADSLGFW